MGSRAWKELDIDNAGQIKFGPADPTSSWKVSRYFHIDTPHPGYPYVHINADVGPLNRLGLNHQRLPSFMNRLGNSSVVRTLGKGLLVLGVAKSTYDVVDMGLEGGDAAKATSQEVGGWTGAAVGAAIGVALGGGTPLSIPLGLLGAGIGGAIGYEAGGALYDFASKIFHGN